MFLDPIVLIEQSANSRIEVTEAVIAGCQRALGEGACGATPTEPNSDATLAGIEYSAVLVWDRAHRKVSIQVRAPEEHLTRELQFQQHDELPQRGLAAGLVTAALVAQYRHRRGVLAPQQEPQPAERNSPQQPPSASAAPIQWRFDAAALLGESLKHGPAQFGAGLRVSIYGLHGLLYPIAGVDYTESAGELDTEAWRGFVGLGARLAPSRSWLALELSAGWAAEHVRVRASDGVRSDAGERFRFGTLVDGMLIGEINKSFQVFVGAHGTLLWPEVGITQGGNPPTFRGRVAFGAQAGLRLSH